MLEMKKRTNYLSIYPCISVLREGIAEPSIEREGENVNIKEQGTDVTLKGKGRPVTLSDFPHLHNLGHSMSALCTISCLLSDQGLKIPKSDLFVYELKPVSVYRCTPAVISPSLDLLFIRISPNIARGQ